MIDYAIAVMSSKPGTKKEDIRETKAYGTSQVREVLDLDQFCQHIADHNCPFSKGTIKGVLEDAVSCLREQMLAGNKVNLGALGGFYVELATEGAKTTDEFTAANIKEVNVIWCPGKNFKNLREDATFNLVPRRIQQAEAIEVVKNEETIQGLE